MTEQESVLKRLAALEEEVRALNRTNEEFLAHLLELRKQLAEAQHQGGPDGD